MHRQRLLSLLTITSLPLLTSALPPPLVTLLSWSHTKAFNRHEGGLDRAHCFYDQVHPFSGECPLAHSNPYPGFADPALCEQSIEAVCRAVSALDPSDMTLYAFQTGTGRLQGNDTDCFAVVGNGNFGLTLDYNACRRRFATLQSCSDESNTGFNARCVGGSINEYRTTNTSGKEISFRMPRFGLGPPIAFGIEEVQEGDFAPPTGVAAANRTYVDMNAKPNRVASEKLGDIAKAGQHALEKVLAPKKREPKSRSLRGSMPRKGQSSSRGDELYERWKKVSFEEAEEVPELVK